MNFLIKKIKAQTEIINLSLLFFIVTLLVLASFMWGKPLLEKNLDRNNIIAAEQFMYNLDSKIQSIAKFGGKESARLNFGTIELKENSSDALDDILEFSAPTSLEIPERWLYLTQEKQYVETVFLNTFSDSSPAKNITFSGAGSDTNTYIKIPKNTTITDARISLKGYPSSYIYRRPVIISNSGSAQTNYQVNITLDTASLITAGKMRSDCGDIRFIDSDGSTQLNYWLESGCNSASTKLWVKVPSVPVGSKTIYIYYGNLSATSASNGKATFEVYDDFNDGVIDNTIWNIHVRNGGNVIESGGELIHDNDINWSGENHYTVKTFNKSDALIIDFWIRYPLYYGFGGNGHTVFFFNTSQVTWTDTHYDDPGNAAGIVISPGTTYQTYDTKWRITLFGNGYYSLTRLEGTNYMADVVNQPISNWHIPADPIVIDFNSATYGNMDTYWDDIIIRKYASPEPTVVLGGEEKIGLLPTNVAIDTANDGKKDIQISGSLVSQDTYRKPVTISNSGSAQTDYQVNITLDTASLITAGKMRSDCGDIRFIDSDGTQLNYWLESGCNSASTKLWVKVPSVPSGSKTIYIYYGNPSATSASSVTNTFIREIDGVQPVKGSWHFDEGSGTVAGDTSGNGNAGTLYSGTTVCSNPPTAGCPTWTDGKFGKALKFDGVNDYVSIPNNPALTPPRISFMAWINPVTWNGPANYYRAYWLNGRGHGYAILSDGPSSASPGLEVFVYTGTWYELKISTLPSTGSWHFIAGVYDGSTLKIYVDGIESGSIAASGNLATYSADLRTVFGYHLEGGYYANGIIDEVQIYNRSLNATEISDLYNNYGYTTPNYPGRTLVRKFALPEPTAVLGGEISQSNLDLNITAIQEFLKTCAPDAEGYCLVPLKVSSESSGIVELSGLGVKYTVESPSKYRKIGDLTDTTSILRESKRDDKLRVQLIYRVRLGETGHFIDLFSEGNRISAEEVLIEKNETYKTKINGKDVTVTKIKLTFK